MSLAAVAYGIGTAASIGGSIYGGLKAGDAAEEAAEDKARLVAIQRAEERRRRRLAGRQKLGQAKAAVYASNLQMSGSTRQYVNALSFENMRELAYIDQANRLEQEAILAGGEGAGTPYFMDALGTAAGAAINVGSRFLPSSTSLDTNAVTKPSIGDVSGWEAADRYMPGVT